MESYKRSEYSRVTVSGFYATLFFALLLASLLVSEALRLSRPPLFLVYLAGLGLAVSITITIAYSNKPAEEKALYFLLVGSTAILSLYPVIKRTALFLVPVLVGLVVAYIALQPRTPRVVVLKK